MKNVTGGQLLVQCLEQQGVENAFCVPGESYLAVLDALVDSPINMVNCRHEGAAAMMAETTGKLTGRPGVAMVTRGPGATNASAGVHIAQQDSSPMVLLIGQVERAFRGRDAFQEVDYRAFYGTMAKWVEEIDDASRIPEVIAKAWQVAMSDRPGPVVLSLPEDMLRDEVAVVAASRVEIEDPAPGAEELQRFNTLLDQAVSPVMIVGGSRWNPSERILLADFARNRDIPVVVSFRRQMLIDNLHESYAGDLGLGINPDLASLIRGSDLVILLGTRLSEISSHGYTLLDNPDPGKSVIHVHRDDNELGRVYQAELMIQSSPGRFLAALGKIEPTSATRSKIAHAQYLKWSTPTPQAVNGVDMGEVMNWLSENLADDVMITNGAGNYTIWVQRFFRFRRFASLVASTSGSMGYGLPAAISAKLNYSERQCVCFAGDGCFQMTSQEFATVCQLGLQVIVLVIDNSMYGTIRLHQERQYPSRISATDLVNPDFAALAVACGGHGETVESTAQFAKAFKRAQASGKPAILHLKVDPDVITPVLRLSTLNS